MALTHALETSGLTCADGSAGRETRPAQLTAPVPTLFVQLEVYTLVPILQGGDYGYQVTVSCKPGSRARAFSGKGTGSVDPERCHHASPPQLL